MHTNKTAVAELMRIAWRTVGWRVGVTDLIKDDDTEAVRSSRAVASIDLRRDPGASAANRPDPREP
ncbi:MAG: hypothetical protein JO153_18210 [Solirubrobacterales bacterium]|nr:hypothetical protein [Solirubrobacterales bacterium]MBV9918437.1 hypothetical protein [Solirubrobacterales bacterium]